MEELARYQPDLFIIYSGHNEFLERRTYSQIINMPPALRGLGSLTARTRTHTAMRAVMEKLSLAPQPPAGDAANLLDEEVVTLLDDAVGPEAYSRDDELRERVLEHYRFNLARMVDIARSAGAATVLVTPASNLRHCSPFKSEHRAGLGAADLRQWKAHMGAVRQAVAARRMDRAREELEAALRIDDRYAWTSYLLGQALDVLGDPAGAKLAYERARDEDVCPLRAVGATREIVAEVAVDRQVPVADFVGIVEKTSSGGIAGKELFLDHVHPTVGGNRLLALNIMGTMGKAGLLDFDPQWGQAAVDEVTRRVESGLDAEDHGLALMKLSKVMGWAGKLNEADGLARRAVQLLPDDSRVRYQAGLTADLLGRTDEAIAHYRRAVEIQPDADLPHGNLGVALEKKGALAEAVEHYRLAVSHGSGTSKARNQQNLAMGLAKLGWAHLDGGRFERAAEALGEAAELAGDDARVHNLLAIALWETGQRDQARHHYGRALELDPGLGDDSWSLIAYLRRTERSTEADSLTDLP
jgi:tetratricopeptide (TPR) repeat protein